MVWIKDHFGISQLEPLLTMKEIPQHFFICHLWLRKSFAAMHGGPWRRVRKAPFWAVNYGIGTLFADN